MASESICGGFYPNGSSAVNNELNKVSDYAYSVERISTGVYRLSCEPFYSNVGFANASLVIGSNPATTLGFDLFFGASDLESSPRTHDIVVYNSLGLPSDIPFAAGRYISFYFEAIY